MSPAELLLVRSHGIRPIATVSGTCWFSYGRSWTEGHAEGWHEALDRLRREAVAAGANAVVDVRMRTLRHRIGDEHGLHPDRHRGPDRPAAAPADPVIATVPGARVRPAARGRHRAGRDRGRRALRMARLSRLRSAMAAGIRAGAALPSSTQWQTSSWTNQPLLELTDFWERIRRDAHADLRRSRGGRAMACSPTPSSASSSAASRTRRRPPILGRHIVIGTVVDTPRGAPFPHGDRAGDRHARRSVAAAHAGRAAPSAYHSDIRTKREASDGRDRRHSRSMRWRGSKGLRSEGHPGRRLHLGFLGQRVPAGAQGGVRADRPVRRLVHLPCRLPVRRLELERRARCPLDRDVRGARAGDGADARRGARAWARTGSSACG